jgi:hypothetical protein
MLDAMVARYRQETGRDLRSEVAETKRLPILEQEKALTAMLKEATLPLEMVVIWQALRRVRPYTISRSNEDRLYQGLEKANWSPEREPERLAFLGAMAATLIEQAGPDNLYDPTDDLAEIGAIQFDNDFDDPLPTVGHRTLEIMDEARAALLVGDFRLNRELSRELATMARTNLFAAMLLAHDLDRVAHGQLSTLDEGCAREGVAAWLGGITPSLHTEGSVEFAADALMSSVFGTFSHGPNYYRGLLGYTPSGASFYERMEWADRESERLQQVEALYRQAGTNALAGGKLFGLVTDSFRSGDMDYLSRGALVAVDAAMTSFEEREAQAMQAVGTTSHDLDSEHPYPRAMWALTRAVAGHGDTLQVADMLHKHLVKAASIGLHWDMRQVAGEDRN